MNNTRLVSDWKVKCRKCNAETEIDSCNCPQCGMPLSKGIDAILPVLVCTDSNENRIDRSPSTEEIEYFLMLKERLKYIWPSLFSKRIRDESQENFTAGGVTWKEENALDRILDERLQYYLKIEGHPPHYYEDGAKWKADWKNNYKHARKWLGSPSACEKAEEWTKQRGLDRLQKTKLRLRIEDALGL